jgi:7,8-dihydro-6-hydroxymethylpterin dimethyltransferase
MPKIYSHTLSLCNLCKQKINARIIEKNEKVFMEKFCPEHGFSETLISTDVNWYEQSRSYVKPGQVPLLYNQSEFKGCPDSCGFCEQHQQHACLPVIEINSQCNISCPVCLKGKSVNYQMTIDEFEDIIDNLLATEGAVDVLNISGGEPSLHPQLIDFFRLANQKGITQISLSTNGLKLLENKSLRDNFKKYGVIAALQFDGFSDDTYVSVRGAKLAQNKLELIRLFEEEDIPYSLVCTVVNKINNFEVKAITDFFFQSKALTLMFQPVAFSGFADKFDHRLNRITIPEIVKEIEKSSFVNQGDFNPLPCSHYSCFALSYYLKVDEKKYYSLKNFLGKENYLDVIANKTLPGLDKQGYSMMKQKLYEFWSAADSCNMNERILERIKSIYKEMGELGFSQQGALNMGKNHMKAIFIHHFMDVYNFDFSRLVKCCNPYPQYGKRLVPMCAQNVIFN